MKLLLDQNISFKLVKKLEQYFPGSTHVKFVGLSESDDLDVWNFAKNNDFTIVTQDVDFAEMSLIKGIPPKIIRLKCGNTTSQNIFEILIMNYPAICSFINSHNASCIEIF